MKIATFVNGFLQSNCYAIEGENDIVLIDVGTFDSSIEKYVNQNKEKISTILLTHRHFDHLSGVDDVKKITGAKIYIKKEDQCGLYDDVCSLRDICREHYKTANKMLKADEFVDEGDEIVVDSMTFKVIATPGHTIGGVSFLLDGKYLFSGDTLFAGSIGRTDFATGDFSEMKKSLEKLSRLDPSIVVYPGHGSMTTIEKELAENLYLRK